MLSSLLQKKDIDKLGVNLINGYIICGYIDRGKYFSSFQVAKIDLIICQFVNPVRGDGLMGLSLFNQLRVNFFKIHKNLVQYPSNNISIT